MQDLLDLVRYLLERNAYLTDLLLKHGRLIPEDIQEQKIEIPQPMQFVGKMPWEMQKARLERSYSKAKKSEVMGIPDTEPSDVKILNDEKSSDEDDSQAAVSMYFTQNANPRKQNS